MSESEFAKRSVINTHIYGVNNDFFRFQGYDSINIKPGEVAINKRLADYLGVKTGDDLIIRFTEISDIPSDAPLHRQQNCRKSIVMKIGIILEPAQKW